MNIKAYTIFIAILFLVSCNNEEKYIPEGLTKLSDKELIDRVKQKKKIDPDKIVYKNEKGEVISLDSIVRIPNIEEWTADKYVDEGGVVKELIVRKATPADLELRKRLKQTYESLQPTE